MTEEEVFAMLAAVLRLETSPSEPADLRMVALLRSIELPDAREISCETPPTGDPRADRRRLAVPV